MRVVLPAFLSACARVPTATAGVLEVSSIQFPTTGFDVAFKNERSTGDSSTFTKCEAFGSGTLDLNDIAAAAATNADSSCVFGTPNLP